MKNLATLFLSFAATGLILVGCNSAKTPEDSPNPQTVEKPNGDTPAPDSNKETAPGDEKGMPSIPDTPPPVGTTPSGEKPAPPANGNADTEKNTDTEKETLPPIPTPESKPAPPDDGTATEAPKKPEPAPKAGDSDETPKAEGDTAKKDTAAKDDSESAPPKDAGDDTPEKK